jgi:hypothetical protein
MSFWTGQPRLLNDRKGEHLWREGDQSLPNFPCGAIFDGQAIVGTGLKDARDI